MCMCILPAKAIPAMTYTVSVGTLKPYSLTHSFENRRLGAGCSDVVGGQPVFHCKAQVIRSVCRLRISAVWCVYGVVERSWS